jgi:hypothetical protein
VESCSALVESGRGELSLLRWPHAPAAQRRRRVALLADAA